MSEQLVYAPPVNIGSRRRSSDAGVSKAGRKKKTEVKTKEEEVFPPGEEWRCITCGVRAHETPLKRRGADGKRNICNACYVRMRVKTERAERGTARPVLPPGGLATPIKNILSSMPQLSNTPSTWSHYVTTSVQTYPYSGYTSPTFISNYQGSTPQNNHNSSIKTENQLDSSKTAPLEKTDTSESLKIDTSQSYANVSTSESTLLTPTQIDPTWQGHAAPSATDSYYTAMNYDRMQFSPLGYPPGNTHFSYETGNVLANSGNTEFSPKPGYMDNGLFYSSQAQTHGWSPAMETFTPLSYADSPFSYGIIENTYQIPACGDSYNIGSQNQSLATIPPTPYSEYYHTHLYDTTNTDHPYGLRTLEQHSSFDLYSPSMTTGHSCSQTYLNHQQSNQSFGYIGYQPDAFQYNSFNQSGGNQTENPSYSTSETKPQE